MNKEWEKEARQKGFEYFGEDFLSSTEKDKYKRERYLNTALWWFRNNNKKIIVFTNVISDIFYLYKVFTKECNATIFFRTISPLIRFEDILKYFKDTQVSFRPITFIPNEEAPFYTKQEQRIPYSTIILAGDNTIIFDKKQLGLYRDNNGNTEVYRIKDRSIYQKVKKQFIKLLGEDF